MCTGVKYRQTMGRNYDYEKSFNEQIIRVNKNEYENRYDVIGIGTGMVQDYPLLYDGMNEHGLCVCGLAFANNAKYYPYQEGKSNVAAFDFTFYVLGHYKSVSEFIDYFDQINIWCEPFSDEMPNSPLHWLICDRERSIVVESTEKGLHWYDAETGVLTNNPPYPEQIYEYRFNRSFIGGDGIEYGDKRWESRGLATNGLDGAYTSDERFERISFLKEKLEDTNCIFNQVSQTFHLLSSVEQIYGATPVDDKFEYTIYSVVYDMETLKVYIKKYNDLSYGLFSLHDASLYRYTF